MTPKVVISYSKEDSTKYRNRIHTHFSRYIDAGRLELWDDSKIETGELWDPSIRAAFESADAAIVLLSAPWKRRQNPNGSRNSNNKTRPRLPYVTGHPCIVAGQRYGLS